MIILLKMLCKFSIITHRILPVLIQLASLALCCIVPMYNQVSSLSVFSKIFQVSVDSL